MPDARPTDVQDLEQVVAAVVDRQARRYCGLSIGVLTGDQRATIGYGRVGEGGPPPNRRTSFQIGSVTKVFTGLLLADAVERGEVALDQPLDSILTGVATHPAGRPITLLDLATHSSGLPRLPPGLREQALRSKHDPYASLTGRQVVEALAQQPPRPPGARARYSTFGVGVLGAALSRVTGRDYEDLVRTRIAGPLGMHDTSIDATASREQRAVGHSRWGRPVVDWRLPALPGAGALRSTADDLLTFLDAHLRPDGTPLAGAIGRALVPRVDAGRHLRVALGWHVLDRKDGTSWWWHNGGTGGFFSFVGFDPGTHVGVAVLTNTARSVDRIGAALLQRLAAEVASRSR